MKNFDQIYNDEQQLLFYLNLISNPTDLHIHKPDLLLLMNVCCNASFKIISYKTNYGSPYFSAILGTIAKQELNVDNVIKFCKKHIPDLTRDLHIYFSNCIHENTYVDRVRKEKLELLKTIESNISILSMEGLWLVYSAIPSSYIPVVATSSTPPMKELIDQNCWNCLYQSNKDGLSLNRFNSILSGYKGPTLFFISFDKFIFCIGNDKEWKESKDKLGQADSFLLRLMPDVFKELSGSDIFYHNFSNKSLPRGIHIGSSSKTIVIKIDGDLNFVEYFSSKYSINVIELWGCGGEKSLDEFHKQKLWEKKEALKLQNQKPSIVLEISRLFWKIKKMRKFQKVQSSSTMF